VNLVVADTGPINYLALIGEIEVLSNLWSKVLIPDAVWRELKHPLAPLPVKCWVDSRPQWLEIRSPVDRSLRPSLHLGESQAISLAIEVRAPILLDDIDARRVAKTENLNVFGTIGVLELGAMAGLLDLEKALRALQSTNHRNTPELINAAVERYWKFRDASK
jgi:predicted nucleic acid-binding protein